MKYLWLTLALLCSSPSWASIYYVDSCVIVGSNSNNGTSPSTPWLTLSRAVAAAAAGDTVNLQGGCVQAGGSIITVAGSSGSQLTFTSYGTGQGIIDGTSVTYAIETNGASYINLTNLEIRNAQNVDVFLRNSQNITVDRSTIHAAFGQCIYIGTGGGSHLISNNNIYACGVTNTTFGSGSGIQTDNAEISPSTFRSNYIHDLGSAGGGDHAIYDQTNGDVSQFNYFSNITGGTAIKIDGNNVVVQNNVFTNDASGGIYQDPYSGMQAVGNTFYNTGTVSPFAAIFVNGNGSQTGNVIKNNIDVVPGSRYSTFVTLATSAAGVVSDYNDVYGSGIWWGQWSNGGSYSSLAAWKTGTSQDAHSIASNPLFSGAAVGIFTLQAGSPAIDAGANLGSTYQTGILPASTWPAVVSTANQSNYGAGWEMGAFIFPTIYSVLNTDGDSNNGMSTSTPWRTIAHVNGQTF